MADYEPPFQDPDRVLGAIAQHLAADGDEALAASLVSATVEQIFVEYDNWDGGTTRWDFAVRLAPPEYQRIGEAGRDRLATRVNALLQEMVPEIGFWVSVSVSLNVVDDPDWRASLLKDRGILTNQGRAFSKNPAWLEHDGLYFRSQPEKTLYDAFKKSGAIVAPLPVFVRGGERFSRVEPDFVLVRDGVVVFIEVDGRSYHKETPADAHYRLKPFEDEGVRVMRVKAEDVSTAELAAGYVRGVLLQVDKWRKQR